MQTKINLKALLWTIVIYIFAFQRVLVGIGTAFSYIDEIMAICTIIFVFLKLLVNKKSLRKNEIAIIILWVLIIGIGVVGNVKSQLFNNKFAIIVDLISMIKVWLSYYTIIILNHSLKFYDDLLLTMARVARILISIMLVCLICSQFVDIGMLHEVRYGIRSFKFLFDVPGNFSKLFYFIVPLLTVDLQYSNTRRKKIYILLALFLWTSSLRSRAFAFVAVYVLAAMYFFNQKANNIIKNKIKIRYILPIVVVACIIAWDQIVFYFTSSTQARSVLLRYGFVTLLDYFPIGAGFGTFGSDVAAKYYSPLYERYNFNLYYGMRQEEGMFLNDNYWPMVMGQFGIIGLMFVIMILALFIMIILKETRNNKYFYFASFIMMLFLLLSSLASKSYSEYSSICVFLLHGVFVARQRKANQQILINENKRYIGRKVKNE